MRLIAERLLAVPPGTVYLHGELTTIQPYLSPLPHGTLHICCSAHNEGARALIDEINRELRVHITVTEDLGMIIAVCERA